jgi:hypothetical protein
MAPVQQSGNQGQLKATLAEEWRPSKCVEVDTTHAGDQFAQYMYKLHMKSSRGTSQIIIQMPWTTCEQGGIPRSGGQYYETEDKCAFYKHNFLPTSEKDKKALKAWQEFDELMGSKEMRKKLFGKPGVNNHIYTPCVRKAQPPPPKKGEPAKVLKDAFYHLKVKLVTAYIDKNKTSKKGRAGRGGDDESSDDDRKSKKVKPSKKRKGDDASDDEDAAPKKHVFTTTNPQVLTKFLVPRKGDKKGYDPIDVQTVPEARKAFPWKSEFRDILRVMHVWETKTPDRSGNYGYGVTIKAAHIYVKAAPRSSNEVNEDVVITDNEGSDGEAQESKGSKKGSDKKSSKNKAADSDQEKNSDSEAGGSDSDSDSDKKDKKKKRAPSTDDEGSDAGSGSDSDSDKKKKTSKKGSSSDDSDSDAGSGSDSDSDKKKNKKKSSKKGSDDEASDSDAGSDSDSDKKKKDKKKSSKDSDADSGSDSDSDKKSSSKKKGSKKGSDDEASSGDESDKSDAGSGSDSDSDKKKKNKKTSKKGSDSDSGSDKSDSDSDKKKKKSRK